MYQCINVTRGALVRSSSKGLQGHSCCPGIQSAENSGSHASFQRHYLPCTYIHDMPPIYITLHSSINVHLRIICTSNPACRTWRRKRRGPSCALIPAGSSLQRGLPSASCAPWTLPLMQVAQPLPHCERTCLRPLSSGSQSQRWRPQPLQVGRATCYSFCGWLASGWKSSGYGPAAARA